MRKLTQGLAVNNSSNQTGIAHHTDYSKSRERLQKAIELSLELQRKLDELYLDLFKHRELDEKFSEALERISLIVEEDLSPMIGTLYVIEITKKGVAV